MSGWRVVSGARHSSHDRAQLPLVRLVLYFPKSLPPSPRACTSHVRSCLGDADIKLSSALPIPPLARSIPCTRAVPTVEASDGAGLEYPVIVPPFVSHVRVARGAEEISESIEEPRGDPAELRFGMKGG